MTGRLPETHRLVFRPYTLDDLEFYASLWGDPQVVRYIGSGRTKTAKEAARTLHRWLVSASVDSGAGLFLAIDKSTGCRVGHAGIVRQNLDGCAEWEIGYWLAPEWWGQGLAKEAAGAFRDYGFRQLGKKRLIALVQSENKASASVAKAVGMEIERDLMLNGRRVHLFSVWGPL
ncbi:GNAT family N-acetyltransferase [Salinithrix halophila]|uniref:GNAT family N-acetyltransferase n=1 Tax=Salinithrix halophila TaxID=1485204 RepID=A0ABV8JHS4_9BACL